MTDLEKLSSGVVEILKEKNLSLALAESMTGGLVAKSITDIPGSSSVFCCGYVTYTDGAKVNDLGVDQNTLKLHTAVSPQVAREMVIGLHNRTGCRICVSVTGYAGPGGKDDGHYYTGLYYNGQADIREYHSKHKDRSEIRIEACMNIFNEILSLLR